MHRSNSNNNYFLETLILKKCMYDACSILLVKLFVIVELVFRVFCKY